MLLSGCHPIAEQAKLSKQTSNLLQTVHSHCTHHVHIILYIKNFGASYYRPFTNPWFNQDPWSWSWVSVQGLLGVIPHDFVILVIGVSTRSIGLGVTPLTLWSWSWVSVQGLLGVTPLTLWSWSLVSGQGLSGVIPPMTLLCWSQIFDLIQSQFISSMTSNLPTQHS